MRSAYLGAISSLLLVIGGCKAGEIGPPTGGDPAGGDTVMGDAPPGDGTGDTQGGDTQGGDQTPPTIGLSARPANSTCVALPRPGPTTAGLALEDAFSPGLNLDNLLDLRRLPSSIPGWVGISKGGDVRVAPDGATSSQTVIDSNDLSGLINSGERGLLGLAVDPDYPSPSAPNTVRIFLNYTGDCVAEPIDTCTYVSRFDLTVAGSGSTATFTAGSEINLMRVGQPWNNHNGGALNFGADGYLYITFGDGGHGNDPWCSGQNLTTPLGKLLRIDVHTTDPDGYVIPAGNPYTTRNEAPFDDFTKCDDYDGAGNPSPGYPDQNYLDVSRADPCPEIFAIGLRNPFRFSVDRENGWIWIGDVGQGAVEEASTMDPSIASTGFGTPYYNFGWPLWEGTRDNTSAPDSLCDAANARWPVPQTFIDPVFEYYHSDMPNGNRGVIVGGFVYRGTALGMDYTGRYFFAEAQTGELWARPNPYAGGATIDVNGLEETPSLFTVGFTEDDNGELLAVAQGAPTRRIVAANPMGNTFPDMLSATGCVDALDPSVPASGLIPYDLQSPLWSDAADKERYIAIPDGETIDPEGHCSGLTPAECLAQGNWELPIGSVAVKVFRRGGVLLETRLMMRHADGGWAGYTYVWNDTQDEAFLADDATAIPGQNWTAPSRAQCLQCHTAAAGRTLGLESAQLNGDLDYPGPITANQLNTLEAIGMFSPNPQRPAAMPDPLDTTQPLEARAKAYLHANCAGCHRPGSLSGSPMDLRWTTAFADMNICNATPSQGVWPPANRLMVPADPTNSLVTLRPRATDGTRMPPLGTDDVDENGISVVEAWISSVSACP